ncbi:MAG TPA: hypothetical protein VM367_00105 [Pseudonocardia sp.]|jgi:hypothetical protein|nr:hypothetical protein [Pseudonocardia sp.]
MADNNNTEPDDSSGDVDTSELDGLDEDDAKRLLEPAGKPARDSATDDTDWRAEAEKWKRLSRQNERAAKERADKLREYEDANKSESQRLQEERDSHKTRAEKAEAALRRREVAEERAPEHATPAQIRAVAKRLAGESDEELEADADELFALLAPAPEPRKVAQRPKERLRGGGDPDDEPDETDPRKLADAIRRGH